MATIIQQRTSKRRSDQFPSRFRVGIAASLAAFALVVFGGPALAGGAATIQFNIPPQPLSSGVIEFSRQANVQVLTAGSRLQGVDTPGVNGSFSVTTGIEHLLAGTGFGYHLVGNDTISLIPPPNRRVSSSDGKTGRAHPRQSTMTQAQLASAPVVKNKAEPSTLGEIVVTAERRKERLQNVPISMSVLSGRALDNSPYQGVTEVLGTVPGVAANPSYLGGGTQLTVRGVTAGDPFQEGASPIAYYLDDVPFGLIVSAFTPDEDVYDLKRIEVLRGPQGTLYGAGALNGVVRVLTNDADLYELQLKGRVSDSGTYTGGNNYRGDFAANVPIVAGKLAIRAVVGYESDSGWIDTPIKSDINTDELRNYRLKIGANPTDNLSLRLEAWSTRDAYGAPSTGKDNRSTAILDQAIKTDFDMYGAQIDYVFPMVSISSMTSYLDYSNTSGLDLSSFAQIPYDLVTKQTANVTDEDLVLNSQGLTAWSWSVGGRYRRATDNASQYDELAPAPLVRDLTSRSWAVFGEVTRRFFDNRLDVTGGLAQFEDHIPQNEQLAPDTPYLASTANFHATTPRAVVAWHANRNTMIYLSYAQGFRSGAPQDATTAPAGIPPVLGDKLNNYEIGAKGNVLGDLVNYDVALYLMDWQHIQQAITVPYQGFPYTALVNGKSARGEGVDFSLTVHPIRALTVGMTFSGNNLTMNSDVVSAGTVLFARGARPNYSPEITAGGFANYLARLGSSGLSLRLSASDNFTSSILNRQQLGPNVIVERGSPISIVRFSCDIESGEVWSASLFVNNATNESRTPLPGVYDLANLDARLRPRTIGLQIEYRLE